MRDQLRDLTEKDYWVCGITEADFDHIVDLVRELIGARIEQHEKEMERDWAKSPDAVDTFSDVVAYYMYTDNQYLWHFALWRLQGLIEAVIAHQLIEGKGSKKLFGLKAKLEELQRSGYSITAVEIGELILWANLRNAISHAPPERGNPGPLREEDIVEYHGFVKELYLRWQQERPYAVKI